MNISNDIKFSIFLGIIIASAFFFILGITGLLVALGLMVGYIFVFYLILNNFELDMSEKIVFSFFISIGIFPSIVYLLGLMMSFRIAIAVTFILLIFIAYLIKKLKKK
ncbi:MAG TPA: hypothetical protein QF458_03665 [Candidatus Woesearchaeota archaeon]|jgi:uncharacterized membrane protein|nr:hypothetical protein [Candidatus Woesearchaeota archaeon]|tara:strand:+ start:664 stop:987 length:324 start_codon:yes stop_codon:yes gene_type:complete